MNRINKKYKYIGDYIHNYLNDGKIEYEQLMDFELSLQDLSIQINKLVFVFNQIALNENNGNDNNGNDNENIKNKNQLNKMDKIDYALDKTIFHFLPLLFMYFMIFDNESILHIKDFVEKKDTNNYINNNNTNNKKTNKNNNTNTFTLTKEEILNDLD